MCVVFRFTTGLACRVIWRPIFPDFHFNQDLSSEFLISYRPYSFLPSFIFDTINCDSFPRVHLCNLSDDLKFT